MAVAEASCAASTGATTIGFLQVGTTLLVNVTAKPNTEMSLGALGTLTFNEQTATAVGILVNAVHLSGPAVDLVLSSAQAGFEGCTGS